MRCPSCNHDNRAERRFCAECGATLAAPCAGCGASNEPGEKFCGQCGASLIAAPIPSAAPPRPPGLAPAALSPGPDGERRQLTVLFCDLVGSTPLSQQVDAEEWRDIIAQYQQAAAGAVARFGGHVAKNLGDGLLIYFGWPTAREDDPERAVRAGLAIVDAMAPLNASLAANDGTRLAVRIGMHTGPVVIADGGEVFGETGNIAARVQGAADPDTVVITAATQRLVAGMFVVEDRGPQMLKGVREPVTLYRVVQPSGVRSRLAVAAGRLTRFVGRDIELATLVDRWERTQDGEGQTVVVIGEAGVGKSRLVYQLHEHLATVPHTWLECGATPYTEGTPFHPIIALVAQGLAFAPEDTAAERLGKLEGGLRDLVSAETVALLADFLGLPPPAPLQMSAELQRRKTIDLLAQWTMSLSAAQPLVLFVEDLHWCDASTLELLGHLIAQSSTARVLLLATARPEFTVPWPARSNLSTVQLARLTNRHARDMVTALGGPALSADTLDALVARADGVPLYVEELTKAVLEEQSAVGAHGRAPFREIPATLADSLMARLDRLSAAKQVAQRAAVLGREFGFPLLAATAGLDEAALCHGLVRLVDAEILFARGAPPATTYTFKHALIQETAYHSLLKRTRQQLHNRVVDVLLAEFPEQAAAEPEVVAHHYTAANLLDHAIPYWQKAGNQAAADAAHAEAVKHYFTALELLMHEPEGHTRDQRELELQTALALNLAATRGYAASEVEQAYNRAYELCQHLGATAELFPVLRGLCTFYIVRDQQPKARQLAEQCLHIAEESRRVDYLIEGYTPLGYVLAYQGEFERARDFLAQGIALYEAHRGQSFAFVTPQDSGVACLGLLATVQWMLGYPDQALRTVYDALALAQELNQPFNLAYAYNYVTGIHSLRGELNKAIESGQAAFDISSAHGFDVWRVSAGLHLATAQAISGDLEAAVTQLTDGLAAWRACGTELLRPMFLVNLAEICRLGGKHDQALAAVQEGLAHASHSGEHEWDSLLYRVRGGLMLAHSSGGHEAAACDFRKAIAVAREQDAKSFELAATTSLTQLLIAQGRRVEAKDLLEPVYAWFTEGFDTWSLRQAKSLLAKLS